MKRLAGLLLAVAMASPARADVVLQSNEVALGLIRRHSTSPPVAARTLAMVHVAIFDALNSIERRHQPFRVYVAESPQTSSEAAALQAAFGVLMHVYSADREKLERELVQSLDHLPSQSGRQAGVRLGNIVADRIIAWRSGDGSDVNGQYTPKGELGRWRPTPPDYRPALLPQWARLTPFGIDSGSQFRPDDPPRLTSEHYARDLKEVQMLGAADSPVRTEEETEIAHFWADGTGTVTPPGHWNQIAQIVARQQRLSRTEQARLFALLNIALADAAIVCWDMKYHCDLWRPVTAIREADTDGNDDTDADPNWTSLLETPPFPTCTSGHSTFSGAAAEMLALYFGRDDIPFTSTSDRVPRPRSFTGFSPAAEEAGRSRIYGGIHFEFDNESGLSSGRALSRHIYRKHLQPLDTQLVQSSARRQEAFRPARPNSEPGDDAKDLDDGGWRPARKELRTREALGGSQPGLATAGSPLPTPGQSGYGPPTTYAAGATPAFTPQTVISSSPPSASIPLAPYCQAGHAAEDRLSLPPILGSGASPSMMYLPVY